MHVQVKSVCMKVGYIANPTLTIEPRTPNPISIFKAGILEKPSRYLDTPSDWHRDVIPSRSSAHKRSKRPNNAKPYYTIRVY